MQHKFDFKFRNSVVIIHIEFTYDYQDSFFYQVVWFLKE